MNPLRTVPSGNRLPAPTSLQDKGDRTMKVPKIALTVAVLASATLLTGLLASAAKPPRGGKKGGDPLYFADFFGDVRGHVGDLTVAPTNPGLMKVDSGELTYPSKAVTVDAGGNVSIDPGKHPSIGDALFWLDYFTPADLFDENDPLQLADVQAMESLQAPVG